MRASDYFHDIRRVLARNRFRTLLTLLGVVIGSGTIVFLAGVLRRANDALKGLTQTVADADVVVVRKDEAPIAASARPQRELSSYDIEALRRSPLVQAVDATGESTHPTQGRLHGRSKDLTLVAGAPATQALYKLEVRYGRFLRDGDVEARARVCVVGAEVWRDLRGDAIAPGDDVLLQIDGVSWRVVGVLEHQPSIVDSPNALFVWDRKVVVPSSTFDTAFGRRHAVDRIFVRLPRGAAAVHSAIAARQGFIRELLRRLHLDVTNFTVGAHNAFAQQEKLIAGIIRVLMVCTGILALFSGGLNISNIMLIAVGERTREIGIRRAVGATRRSIQLQFLGESALLAIVGGLIGIGLGCALIELVGWAMARVLGSWTVCIEGWSIALGLALSAATGIFFGVAPARKAARLDPVEALRSE
ncbi:MAG: hypothetical protein JWM53_904 [bacterium]|nr:hypothetical protein [bacterium]